MSDGLRSYCKSCISESRREYYIKNSEKVIIKVRRYNKTEKGKESKARYQINNPIKDRCHKIIAMAIRGGRIKRKSCEVCGNTESVAHHSDYSKPYEVLWFCKDHHRKWHSENGAGINGV